MSTTTIRLPDELKMRVADAAERAGMTPHGFILEAIASVLTQTRQPDEIIVVDSWSTDGTPEIATEMGARVVQVKFNGFGIGITSKF